MRGLRRALDRNCEQDRVLKAVLVGMLREDERYLGNRGNACTENRRMASRRF